MSAQIVVPNSLRIGEYLTVLLGFGLSTIAICARIFTKWRITRKFLSEDCKLSAGQMSSVELLLMHHRFLDRWLRKSRPIE